MKVNRKELLGILEKLSLALAMKELIEQSSCFVFRDGDIVTFNDETACRTKSPVDVVGAVKAAPLLLLLRKLTSETVDVSTTKTKDGSTVELLVKSSEKKSRRKAGIVMDQEITLPIDEIEKPKKWKKLPEDFLDAVKITSQCVSTEEDRFELTCVHLHPDYLEACDNYQLVRYPLKLGSKSPILVRGSSLRGVVSIEAKEVSQSENWLHFRNSAGLVLSCRRYAEEFPDVSELLDVEGETIKLPGELKEAIVKADIFSSDYTESNLIGIDLRSGRVRIEGRGQFGWYSETTKIKYGGEPLRFYVGPALLSSLIGMDREFVLGDGKLKVDGGKFTLVVVTEKVESETSE